jgi:hypothetical protein
MKTNQKKSGRGGARPGSGRHPNPDKAGWVKITCLLKRETVETLHREGGNYFGQYLQHHLERYPLPTKEEYEALRARVPFVRPFGRRKVPVIMSAGGISKFEIKVPKLKLNGPQEFEAALSAALKSGTHA